MTRRLLITAVASITAVAVAGAGFIVGALHGSVLMFAAIVVLLLVAAGFAYWLLAQYQAPEAKAHQAMHRAGGVYVGERERRDAAALLDHAFGRESDPDVSITRPFGEPEEYDDRDRWAS